VKPFFNSPERLAALGAVAQSWLDTPFAPHAMVKGAGVDCVHLVAAIYLHCGVLSEFRPPRYSLDAGHHNKDSQLLAWLNDSPRFASVPFDPASVLPGDTLTFNLGLSEHHVGLMLDGQRFIHVLPRRRVIISSLAESYYRRRVTSVFRPVAADVSPLK